MHDSFEVSLKIRRPIAQVFQAVADPAQLSRYFTLSATGPLTRPGTVRWAFDEMPEGFDVQVIEAVENDRIVLEWAGGRTYQTRIEIKFRVLDANNTMVSIIESGWREETDLAVSAGNAGGWMHMMCSLKALLEWNIKLREGGAR